MLDLFFSDASTVLLLVAQPRAYKGKGLYNLSNLLKTNFRNRGILCLRMTPYGSLCMAPFI